MRPTLLVLCLAATACARDDYSPYPYCRGDYESLDADAVTPFGYSAQDAIDLHGLSHTGALTWALVETDYPGPLPPDSDFAVDLEVTDVRWGRYTPDAGNLLIYVTCPDEGMEIDVEGTAALLDLDLEFPVTGRLNVAADRDDPPPPIDELTFSVSHALRGDEVDPFMPAIDGFAEVEDIDYERIEASFSLRLGATESGAGVGVTWYLKDAVMSAGLPWRGDLAFD